MNTDNNCTARNKDGSPCQGRRLDGVAVCRAHFPIRDIVAAATAGGALNTVRLGRSNRKAHTRWTVGGVHVTLKVHSVEEWDVMCDAIELAGGKVSALRGWVRAVLIVLASNPDVTGQFSPASGEGFSVDYRHRPGHATRYDTRGTHERA